MKGSKDIDLLRKEMDLLWGPDMYGRPLRPHPLVAVAVAKDGRDVRFAFSVPNDLRGSFVEDGSLDATSLRESLTQRLTPCDPTDWTGGPSYVFASVDRPASSTLRVLTSEGADASVRSLPRPEPWWRPQEWDDLLAGRFGPWAIGTAAGRVASLCHTSAANTIAAEAGVWTHPEERGRGWAAVVTAAWAGVAKGQFGTLFYSTDFRNLASQAVARKLRLCDVGTIWQLKPFVREEA